MQKEGIPKVVIGCLDPNPLVAGRGIQYLQENNVEVVGGVLEKEASMLIDEQLKNQQNTPKHRGIFRPK